MPIFVAGIFFIGVLLAHFFKFYSLFPVAVLSIFLVFLNPFHVDWTWFGLCVQSAILVTVLQLGFISGVVLEAYLPRSLLRGAFTGRAMRLADGKYRRKV